MVVIWLEPRSPKLNCAVPQHQEDEEMLISLLVIELILNGFGLIILFCFKNIFFWSENR